MFEQCYRCALDLIKAMLDAVPAIDTHDHIWRFEELPGLCEAEDGTRVMNLSSIWRNSYLSWFGAVPGWKPRERFPDWWQRAKTSFNDVRAMSVYRYTLPALRDLYGVDFEAMTDADAQMLNDRIVANYRDQRWLYEVITERANIEVMLNEVSFFAGQCRRLLAGNGATNEQAA